MPFHQCPHAFSARSIRTHAPEASGVYGIANSREWIYIGSSDDIQRSLLEHLAEAGTLLKARLPTGFSFELCQSHIYYARQDRLVLEYEPICNRRAPRDPG